MSDSTSHRSPEDASLADLGPLAWVFDELRKSLDGANKAVRRFLREHEQSHREDLEAVDPASLRLARQQLHQAVGALEMVGLGAPAQVLRAMEAAVHRFIQKPQTCTEAAATQVEQASFALIEYLEAVLGNKVLSPVALFPQYRDVQALAAAERVHPADLWPFEQRGQEMGAPADVAPLQPDVRIRSMLDRLVLLSIKTRSPAAAQQLVRLCAGLSASAGAVRATTFWRVAAAYFEALALDALPGDLYVKRAASRVLLQYTTLAQGQQQVSETLMHDLLFFCAQATLPADAPAPHVRAVRQAFGLEQEPRVDYARAELGQYDPAVLAQARKRIGAAKESWSLFTGGDTSRARQVLDQFSLIGDSLIKLHPGSQALAKALLKAVDFAVRSSQGVRPELAMEVATTTLYLEATFEDFDPNDAELSRRTEALAQRLEGVLSGQAPQPLEPWMEQLYRRISDRQTMGSVVGELKVSLAEAEKSLDQFFRTPAEKGGLHAAVSQLSQMRGVLSVLGLEPAVQTVSRMRTVIEQSLHEDSALAEGESLRLLGNNLSALGFLIDMLSYQPALAKKLFVFDEERGELLPMMGRRGESAEPRPAQREALALSEDVQRVVDDVQQGTDLVDLSQRLDRLADEATLAEHAGVAKAARDAAQAVVRPDALEGAQALVGLAGAVSPPAAPAQAEGAGADDEDDGDLLDIFLEEAREVTGQGHAAIEGLRQAPGQLEPLTALRRAFHTLKGSSRMVGLTDFGEAAWALEQALNAALAEQGAVESGLLSLSTEALDALGQWVEDIAQGRAGHWRPQPFRASADAWRLERRELPLSGVAAVDAPVEPGSDDAVLAAPVVLSDETTEAEVTPDLVPQADGEGPLPVTVEFDGDFVETAPFDEDTITEEDLLAAGIPVPGAEPPPAEMPSLEAIDFERLAALSDRAAEASDEPAQAPAPAGMSFPPIEPPAPDTAAVEVVEMPASAFSADWPELSLPAEVPEAPAPAAVPEELQPVIVSDAEEAPAPDPEPEPASPTAGADEGLVTADSDMPAVAVVAEESADAANMADDTKVIGPLCIGIRLYNVYLNEADEWSRRLGNGLAEWALERHEPLGGQAEALAHSLAGSSATVGFEPLSRIARALEHALGVAASHQQAGQPVSAERAKLFVDAAEDIRRLLHQFAAGFYKEPSAELIAALDAVTHEPLPSLDEGDFDPLASPLDSPWAPGDALAVAEPLPADETPADFGVSTFGAMTALEPPEPRRDGPVQDIDDDIDALDTIDVDLFPIFADEAQELLPHLGGALRQWVARPENASARGEVLRTLHTLKGSARLAGALRLGEMAHRMETEAERLGSDVHRSADVEPLLASFDAISARFDLLRRNDSPAQGVVQTAPEQDLSATPLQPDTQVAGEPLPEVFSPAAPAPEAVDRLAVSASMAPAVPGLQGLALPPGPTAPARAAGAAVRVRPELLDRLVNQAGEVIITRSRLESELVTLRGSLKDLTGNLDRLRQQLRDIELQAETQMQSRLAQAKDANQSFDPLEFDRFTRVQELTRMMAESVNDVATVQRNLQRAVDATEDGLAAQARQTRELQRDLLRTRMVEFEGISERLYRVVRQASKESGKQVRLDMTGGAIEMDRGVLDRMTAAFEHLLRNSVVHGIETPDVRMAAGKPPEGQIHIRLQQELNDVSVTFEDDGAGLNLPKLREKAEAQGFVTPGTQLSDEEAAQLVFAPGLSTATEVSALAGRGVGMDVVRNDVVALGGRVETTTQPGQGTRFKLVLPLTTAVTQVVMVRAGSLAFGVPSNLVEIVRRVSADELTQAYASGTLQASGEAIPFYWAGALLQASPQSQELQGRTLPVVIFRSAAQRVAMHVDEVLGNQEVVVKNLGPQLSRLPGLAGMSVLASGAVALIYNPVALSTVYGAQVREWVLAQQQQAPQAHEPVVADLVPNAVPLVLVVDDSITVRRVTQRLLQREGYRVVLAADGLQALEKLQGERPSVVLSDIEMPRMDGFDLVRNLRNDPRLASLPVIMITSRIATKHRDHARELGVDHYLGKPYAEDELLALIAHYARSEAQA
ncbi:Hpt domain-containing protein [Hydrogenophaga electricum]|uniref:histidine kinase n=1 Tax=Hydrogenophaga electricum TaxID=1230953 RepID=A0ABQ6C5H2_9BURK|nr:Hpt domain-containing protein [Hydrogenophaga electricum]GLS15481.1 hypothetical protein GCM10007935_29170 [Hydrogenophaga electricum]